jgi:hypothetical protein
MTTETSRPRPTDTKGIGPKASTTISTKARAILKEVSGVLFSRGLIVLDSSWMKNPKLHHYFAPTVPLAEGDTRMGMVRVSLQVEGDQFVHVTFYEVHLAGGRGYVTSLSYHLPTREVL